MLRPALVQKTLKCFNLVVDSNCRLLEEFVKKTTHRKNPQQHPLYTGHEWQVNKAGDWNNGHVMSLDGFSLKFLFPSMFSWHEGCPITYFAQDFVCTEPNFSYLDHHHNRWASPFCPWIVWFFLRQNARLWLCSLGLSGLTYRQLYLCTTSPQSLRQSPLWQSINYSSFQSFNFVRYNLCTLNYWEYLSYLILIFASFGSLCMVNSRSERNNPCALSSDRLRKLSHSALLGSWLTAENSIM